MNSRLIPLLLSLCLLLTAASHAEFRLPAGVHEIEDMEAALEKSQARGIPVTFLISDKNTTCGLCTAASQEMFRELRGSTVIIYSSEFSRLPAKARHAIQGTDLGKYIPYAIVLTPDTEKLIGVVRYQEVNDDGRKAFREIKSKIREFKSGN